MEEIVVDHRAITKCSGGIGRIGGESAGIVIACRPVEHRNIEFRVVLCHQDPGPQSQGAGLNGWGQLCDERGESGDE